MGAAPHTVSEPGAGGRPLPRPPLPSCGSPDGGPAPPTRPPGPRHAAAPAGLAPAAPASLPALSAARRLLLQVGVSGPLTRPDLLGRK